MADVPAGYTKTSLGVELNLLHGAYPPEQLLRTTDRQSYARIDPGENYSRRLLRREEDGVQPVSSDIGTSMF